MVLPGTCSSCLGNVTFWQMPHDRTQLRTMPRMPVHHSFSVSS
jgi:hypothetical protein